MSNKKRYTTRATRISEVNWKVSIFSNYTNTPILLEEKSDFTSQNDAYVWGMNKIVEIKLKKTEANRQRNIKNAKKREKALAYKEKIEKMNYAELFLTGGQCHDEIMLRAENLWDDIVFCAVINGFSERKGTQDANRIVGRSKKDRLDNAANGNLDTIEKTIKDQTLQRARQLAAIDARLATNDYSSKEAIESFEKVCLSIPGKKQITIVNHNTVEPFIIDVSDNGYFGYDPSHKLLFQYQLNLVFQHQGSIIVRQFLSLKTEVIAPNGIKKWIPLKKLYGFICVNGGWVTIPAKDLESSYSYDANTGDLIDREPNVTYCEYIQPYLQF